jgi:hypothetical protein
LVGRGVVKRAITAAVLAFALLSEPAHAHGRARGDGDDTPSRLDLSGIALGHIRKDVFLVLAMRRRWRPRELRGGANHIIFEFDSRRSPGSDYYLFVDYWRGRLGGWLYEDDDDFVAQADVYKGGPRVLDARFPARLLRPRDYIRTYALTSFRARTYCRRRCVDFVPDQGWVSHKW